MNYHKVRAFTCKSSVCKISEVYSCSITLGLRLLIWRGYWYPVCMKTACHRLSCFMLLCTAPLRWNEATRTSLHGHSLLRKQTHTEHNAGPVTLKSDWKRGWQLRDSLLLPKPRDTLWRQIITETYIWAGWMTEGLMCRTPPTTSRSAENLPVTKIRTTIALSGHGDTIFAVSHFCLHHHQQGEGDMHTSWHMGSLWHRKEELTAHKQHID